MDRYAPQSEDEVIALVSAAIANDTPLEVCGSASKAALGEPVQASAVLSTRNLRGITLYEPAELVLSARAGTPLAEIRALLDENGQELAFEPMDHGALYGTPAGAGTIGGLVAINASGPRRIKAGALRDHLLGFRAVSGRGEVFKSGGRVMKNVTGYDLSKLIAGSHGTLGVLTEVTLKVLPKAETEQTLLFAGLDDAAGLALLRAASALPHEVSSFAHLPVHEGRSATLLRLEGPEVSVVKRRDDIIAHFGQNCEVLDAAASRALWASVRDVAALAALDAQIWRLSTTPDAAAALVAAIRQTGVPVLAHQYDWAGGLVHLAIAPAPHAHAPAIRAMMVRTGGHATLLRADEEVRASVPVFHPQPAPLAALSRRVKESFDPAYILNRGRMIARA